MFGHPYISSKNITLYHVQNVVPFLNAQLEETLHMNLVSEVFSLLDGEEAAHKLTCSILVLGFFHPYHSITHLMTTAYCQNIM